MEVRDRFVVVTGASSGLGRAIAWRLAVDEGAHVILAARRIERLESLAAAIHAAGGTASFVEVDLAAAGATAMLVERAQQLASGRLFGLVNNAGVTHYGAVSSMDPSAVRGILYLNAEATIELTILFLRAVAGQSERRAAPGTADAAVLTVTSVAAYVPLPYQAVYAASKHALNAFFPSMAEELRVAARSGGPRVVMTVFAPGPIATEMMERSGFNGPPAGSSVVARPEQVARQAVEAWKRERRSFVPGIANRIVAAAGRILPWGLVGRVAERLYRPPG